MVTEAQFLFPSRRGIMYNVEHDILCEALVVIFL